MGNMKDPRHNSEREFVKNFFNHDEWEYEPRTFKLKYHGFIVSYRPDFYDRVRDVYIEVSSTRAAYLNNKPKYDAFREQYPDLKFEIRNPDGSIHCENPPRGIQAYEIARTCPICGRTIKGNVYFYHLSRCKAADKATNIEC